MLHAAAREISGETTPSQATCDAVRQMIEGPPPEIFMRAPSVKDDIKDDIKDDHGGDMKDGIKDEHEDGQTPDALELQIIEVPFRMKGNGTPPPPGRFEAKDEMAKVVAYVHMHIDLKEGQIFRLVDSAERQTYKSNETNTRTLRELKLTGQVLHIQLLDDCSSKLDDGSVGGGTALPVLLSAHLSHHFQFE